MSFLSRVLFGEESTPSQVVNATPASFQQLATPLSQQLSRQLYNPSSYQGFYTAPMTSLESGALNNIYRYAPNVGAPSAGNQALAQQAGFATNPYAGLTGLEGYGIQNIANQAFATNPLIQSAQGVVGQQLGGVMNPYATAAPLGQGETQGLQTIQNQAFQQNPAFQNFVNQQLNGVTNPFTQISAPEQQGLNAIQQTAFSPNQLQGTVNQQLSQLSQGGQNPYAQQLMDAAIRPILQNFTDEALQQRGLYTQAGQKVQGNGSSPFAQASARLSGNVANAIGDTTAQLGSNLFAQQQQAQLDALQLAQQQPGLQLQQQLAATQALGLPRQLQSDAFQQMQANQFAAAGLGDTGATNALQRALAGTQALGLPREVQQQGLDLQNQAFSDMLSRQLTGVGLSDQLAGNSIQRALAGLDAAGVGQERQGAAYEAGANRQLQAGQALGAQELAQQQAQLQAQLSNLQAQSLPRMIQQLGLDAGLNQYNTEQTRILDLMRLIGGLAQPNTTLLPGTAGSTGAVGSFVSGFGQGLGSGIEFSDRRLKKDVQQAGEIGGVPIYRFRYHWDEDDAPLRIGVMSDEVPADAVSPHPMLGYDLVDYGKVFAHA